MTTRYKTIQCVMASLAIVCLTTSVVWSQPVTETKSKKRTNHLEDTSHYYQMVQDVRVGTEIKLTEEQTKHINKIKEELKPKTDALFKEMRQDKTGNGFKKMIKQKKILVKEAGDKVSALLSKSQIQRLKQILIQAGGARALQEESIIKQLKITDQQLEKIDKILDTSNEKTRQLFKNVQTADRKQLFEKVAALKEASDKEAASILTTEQQKKLQEMKGEKFDIKRRR